MARWLVTGASGQLGGHVCRVLQRRSAGVLALAGRGDVGAAGVAVARVDLQDQAGLQAAVREFRPDFVVHAGAMTAVSDAFARPDEARRINTDATRVLAQAAIDAGGRLVFTSTDMVFSGAAAPYDEGSPPQPLSVYGRTKWDAERAILEVPGVLVVRIPLLFGFPVTARASTFASQVASLRAGQELRLFTDEFRTPIWNQDAAAALVALAESGRSGLIHLAGPERLSRCEMMQRVARRIGAAQATLTPISRLSIPAAEPRPADLSLRAALFHGAFPGFHFAAVDDERVLEN